LLLLFVKITTNSLVVVEVLSHVIAVG
jgi:hypothetical protein